MHYLGRASRDFFVVGFADYQTISREQCRPGLVNQPLVLTYTTVVK